MFVKALAVVYVIGCVIYWYLVTVNSRNRIIGFIIGYFTMAIWPVMYAGFWVYTLFARRRTQAGPVQ
jgi:hypothetical protein